MGKFILSEEERKRIKLLYEQNQGFDANDFNKQFADKTSEGAIKNTFGEELYKKTSDLAKKFGMTLIERDYQHHMWSKDLKYGKLILLITATLQELMLQLTGIWMEERMSKLNMVP
jgi:hypothetical protein